MSARNRTLRKDYLLLREPGGILDGLLDVVSLEVRIAREDVVEGRPVRDLPPDHRHGDAHTADARAAPHDLGSKVMRSKLPAPMRDLYHGEGSADSKASSVPRVGRTAPLVLDAHRPTAEVSLPCCWQAPSPVRLQKPWRRWSCRRLPWKRAVWRPSPTSPPPSPRSPPRSSRPPASTTPATSRPSRPPWSCRRPAIASAASSACAGARTRPRSATRTSASTSTAYPTSTRGARS